jgi:hypothetical protein
VFRHNAILDTALQRTGKFLSLSILCHWIFF